MNNKMTRLAFVASLCLLFAQTALADVRIISSSGGEVGSYLSFFSKVKRSGERVIIDGPCLSACTLVLSTLPRSRICVTSRAVLGFHAPTVIDQQGHQFHSRKVTKAMASTYPTNVQRWINRNGGLSRNLIYLRGRELTALYPRC
jgi:hypothetical protein